MSLRGDTPSPPPNARQVLDFLNQSIDWHRGVASEEQVVTDPADVLFINNSHLLSNQALQLSFDFARAYAQYLAQQKPAPASEQANSSGPNQGLAGMAAAADKEAAERQEQLKTLQRQAASARGAVRERLRAQIAAMQSEIELEQVRAETLRSLLQFSGGAGGGGSLLSQVNELQRSVPELESGGNTPPANSTTASNTRAAHPTGIVAIAEDLITLGRKARTLSAAQKATDDLAASADKLRRPLVATLTSIAEEGDRAVEQSAAPGDFQTRKRQLDALTTEFKQLSTVVLPLGKQAILLDSYRGNLTRWRQAVSGEYQTEVKTLVIRLIVLGLVLVAVIIVAEAWRKAIFRYVHDLRRRYQLLLIRRILLWITIAIAVAMALASQIGSLATFAGLITAGIAVALQNVILAVAGYFFLIGKYGVRVGDRVQIASVTGVVVDIGLVRLHLMELDSPDAGRQPTGRIVVFSNAIVFQAGASFFKQIPGTSFTWHELTLTLAPDTDYHTAERRLLAAAEAVYSRYHEQIERQHRAMQDNLNLAVAVPRPHTRLRLTKGGLEVVIRFPTELENSAEMDDAVAREVLQAIEQSPRLKLVGSGTPTIQPAPEAVPQPKSA